MSYSILRVSRVKSSVNTRGLQRHNQRENENYNNKDINHEETYKNYDLINQQNIDYNQKIEELIQENYTQKRKIRKEDRKSTRLNSSHVSISYAVFCLKKKKKKKQH